MTQLPKRLPKLAKERINSDKWVDEDIWGHRLYDEQTPWMTLLEFLNVFCHESQKSRALEEPNGYNTLEYSVPPRWELRHILFNDPKLDLIQKENGGDNTRWDKWLSEMNGVPRVQHPGFGYLREHFGRFDDFVEVVNQLRISSIEGNSNKRWTSKFVFPYGSDCLYEDLDQKGTNDRRFFGRTGELLYLMLCRCRPELRAQLVELIRKRLLNDSTVWNRVCRALQPSNVLAGSLRQDAYLPYQSLPAFDALAEDWIALLRLNFPEHDVMPHLVNVTGLHLLRYFLGMAKVAIGENSNATFVCEIVAPKKTFVRERAIENYLENNGLSLRAVETYLSSFQKSQEWQQALVSAAPFASCKALLAEHFLWGDDYSGPDDADKLFASLVESAKSRHRQHLANIHRAYGREIGLVSKRGTNRLRYAPTDELLKGMLFTCVDKRMELKHFMSRLYQRYGLVFGSSEAACVLSIDLFEMKPFEANARRLEQRLGSLGLLKRLSDGCAYVINPYAGEKA